jgi:hypothetical protein
VSARKIVEGLDDDDDDKLHDRLAALEDTYLQQSPDEIKGDQGLLEILKAQLGTTDKANQILKEVQLYFLKTGAMTLPLQAI